MEKKVFNNLFNHINYKTFRKFELGSIVTCVGTTILSAIDIPNTLVDGTFTGAAFTSLVMFTFLILSGGVSKTKDISEIRELYNEFLDEYIKLNKDFDFKNPIEISTMYAFLLNRGYLSNDKNYQFTSNGVVEVNSVDGANILCGRGVCRHIAGMLTDIFNKSGVDASRLCVYSPVPEIKVKIIKEQKYTIEELYDIARSRALDEDMYNLLVRLIKEYAIEKGKNIEFEFCVNEDENLIRRKIGNHAITYVVDNGVTYYLDPTLNSCYLPEDDSTRLYDSLHFPVDIKIAPSIIFNDVNGFQRLRNIDNKEFLTWEEMRSIRDNTRKICKDNMDIFERFYNDNQELYGDISEKVLRLKKR